MSASVEQNWWEAACDVVARIRESRKYSAHFGSKTLLYFIESDCGPIKIGITDNPVQRMKALQNASSCRLEYVALHAADTQTEAGLHEHLAEWRLHGEWFEPSSLVLAMARYYRELGLSYPPVTEAWPAICGGIASRFVVEVAA